MDHNQLWKILKQPLWRTLWRFLKILETELPWKCESEVAQSCPTLSDPMDWSLPGSSIHGIFQARVLEWVAIAFSENCLMTQQSHCWAYTPRKPELKETHAPQCSLQHCLFWFLVCEDWYLTDNLGHLVISICNISQEFQSSFSFLFEWTGF